MLVYQMVLPKQNPRLGSALFISWADMTVCEDRAPHFIT